MFRFKIFSTNGGVHTMNGTKAYTKNAVANIMDLRDHVSRMEIYICLPGLLVLGTCKLIPHETKALNISRNIGW